MLASVFAHPALPRAVPFVLYVVFLASSDVLARLVPGLGPRVLYPLQIGLVAAVMFAAWSAYTELSARARPSARTVADSVLAGLVVFVLWISLDAPWMLLGGPKAGYAPLAADGSIDPLLALVRLMGAALVVPVMEELFWRSLVMRWIDRHDFLALAPAAVSLRAVLVSSAIFAVEHSEWLAGLAAGLIYAELYRRRGTLWAPVIAHAVTNAVLGCWVLWTRNWSYW